MGSLERPKKMAIMGYLGRLALGFISLAVAVRAWWVG